MSNRDLDIYQKQTNRRLDGLEKNVELILKVLNNFVDDMEPEIENLKSALHANKEKQTEVKEELQKDLKQIQFGVEDKVDEIKGEFKGGNVLFVKNNKVMDKIKNFLRLKRGD